MYPSCAQPCPAFPPPCRLWYAFLAPPKITLSARPVLGGRVLRYGALLNRVSALLRAKLLKAVNRQLVGGRGKGGGLMHR